MNSYVVASRMQLKQENLKNLLEEVKETVAPEVLTKKFTSVDLWQIERSRKTAAGYTRKWNLN
jgi:hypothetical protein